MAPAVAAGALLRRWRESRRVSQLALALDAGISARHLSFIETGRARPSREVVLALARGLALPFRERNALLEAAGHAREYPEAAPTAPAFAAVERALAAILERQEPFGAVVLDRHWNVLRVNRGQARLLRMLLPHADLGGRLNHMDLIFDPDGLRPFIENWPLVARALLDRLEREVLSAYSDEDTLSLRERLLAYSGIEVLPRRAGRDEPAGPCLEMVLAKGDMRVSLFTTITTIGTPLDVTAEELRVESFFPADRPSEGLIRALAGE